MTTKSIGIVGCGAIGKALIVAGDSEGLGMRIAGVTSRTEGTARSFLSTLRNPPPYLELDDLVSSSDLVVEAAGASVVPDLARRTFANGKDLMIISIGVLLDHPEIVAEARKTGCQLYAPSGAIAGLDGIKSASTGKIERVVMTSRKPPIALEGAPYLVEHNISLDGLTEEMEVFSGTAREGCKGFPANLNVSAAVSLAGIGPDKTQLRVVAVPGLKRNVHDIEVEGEFGYLAIHIENNPSENPKTGRLTALSIIRSVQDVADKFHVGT